MSGNTTPDFSHMNFDDNLVNDLWSQIKELLHEQGRVYSYDLVENGRIDYGDYSKDYIRNRVLPAMRERLEQQDIIQTEQEIGENNTGRLVWVMTE